MKNREDIKIVIMSATLDAGKFQNYFDDAPLIVSNEDIHMKHMYLYINTFNTHTHVLSPPLSLSLPLSVYRVYLVGLTLLRYFTLQSQRETILKPPLEPSFKSISAKRLKEMSYYF